MADKWAAFKMSTPNDSHDKWAEFELPAQANHPMRTEDEDSWLTTLPRNIAIGLAQIPQRYAKDAEEMFKPSSVDTLLPMEQFGQQERYGPDLLKGLREADMAKVMGQKGPGTLLDQIIQGGVSYAPEILSLGHLAHEGLKKVPLLKPYAVSKLNQVAKSMENIAEHNPQIHSLLSESKGINPELLAKAQELLPADYKYLAEAVKGGGYGPAFTLQSDLGKLSRALGKREMGLDSIYKKAEVDILRNKILEEMDAVMRHQGFHKEADLFKQGRNDFRKYIQYRSKIDPVLTKIGIPATKVAALGLVAGGSIKGAKKLIKD